MPRTKFDKPRYPPINNLRAAILERKFVARLSWDDLASAAGISGASMRKLATAKPPDEWPPKVRTGVCRLLDIKLSTTIVGE